MNTTEAVTLETVNATQLSNATNQTFDATELMIWRVGVYGIGGAVIECFGLIGNIISIIVLAYFRNKSSAPFLLICLAVLDSMYLIAMFFLENLTHMSMGKFISNSYRIDITPIYAYTYPIPFVLQTCATYLVVIITLERYTVVASPFIAHRFWTRRNASVAVVGILCFGILYHIPDYMAFSLDYNRKKIFWRSEFGFSHFFLIIYRVWIRMAFNFIIPFILLLVFNILLIKTLRNKIPVKAVGQARNQREQRLTFMVICMTAIFFLCQMLAALSLALTAGFNVYTEIGVHLNRFAALSDFFVILNSAINFIIYCATGRKFRDTFCYVFCSWRGRPPRKPKDATGSSKSDSRIGSSSPLRFFSLLKKTRRAKKRPITTTESAMSSFSSATRSSRAYSISSDSLHARLSTKNNPA